MFNRVVGYGQCLVLRKEGVLAGVWLQSALAAFVLAFVVGLPLGGEGREWLSAGVIGLVIGVVDRLGDGLAGAAANGAGGVIPSISVNYQGKSKEDNSCCVTVLTLRLLAEIPGRPEH